MASEASGGSGARFNSKVVLAAATGAAVAVGAAYYVYSKSTSTGAPEPSYIPDISFENLKKWKEEGNTHFIQKRYAEAIDCFSTVIDECERTGVHERSENANAESAFTHADLLAVCYQNRAAARQAFEDSPLDVIADCSKAILLKPKYGRAYIRRANLLKKMQPRQALSDALSAMHIDEKFAEQMAGMMGELMGALEQSNLDEFTQRKERMKGTIAPQKITQDQVFTFLHKTLSDDLIRNLFFNRSTINSASLAAAFECMDKRDFEGALAAAVESDEPECLLLAARLQYYQGCHDKFEASLGKVEAVLSSAPSRTRINSLKISYAIIRIETAESLQSLLELFEAAVTTHGALPDFFSAAAFRCTFFDAWEPALSILTDSRLEHSKLTQVFCFFVQINAIILRNENPMESFKIIAKFEEFVDSLDNDDPHKNWAVFALSKIYITFNNSQNAEALLKELCKRDSSWALYPVALAHVYTQKSEYKEALELAEKTVQMEKCNPEAQLLLQSLRLHRQGNKLEPAPFYVSLRAEAEPLLARCLSDAEFPFVNEVLRHIAFIDAKISAANSLKL